MTQTKNNRVELTCAHCGTAFWRRPCDIKAKHANFCSRDCREASKKRPPIVREDGTAIVPLTRGMVAIIDADMAAEVGRYTWYASESEDGRFYAKTSMGDGRNDYLHRLILGFDVPLGDHISGDTLDNRRCNLRPASDAENMQNRARHRHRTLPKGVYLSRSGRFYARICHNGKDRCLGTFDMPEDAARAYDAKARELFGAFARCNVSEDHVA